MTHDSRKILVLDTNVLLHNPHAIFAFADSHVVIPIVVLEELDRFKTANNELGRNSREVARMLDRLRATGSLRDGIATERGGIIQVAMESDTQGALLPGLADNQILGCANLFKRQGREVCFISKDINARIKANALGIPADDYDSEKVNIEELYAGWRSLAVTVDELQELRAKGTLNVPHGQEFWANEFAAVANGNGDNAPVLARFRPDRKKLVALPDASPMPYGIGARNREQHFVLDLLLDDDVSLVTLVGSAGTGKTLLALAAGLTKVLREDAYAKMLVSRPIMPLGKDIGYLPGTKDDKMSHWMGPIFDNLQFILQSEESNPDDVIKRLIKDETIILEALTYIRGRSISNHFLIVDEAQNLTPHEIKTIISRAGERTKIVVTGDPYQIDNPYLDSNSNGLTYLVQRMRGQDLAGHVTLTRSERSELAALAAELL